MFSNRSAIPRLAAYYFSRGSDIPWGSLFSPSVIRPQTLQPWLVPYCFLGKDLWLPPALFHSSEYERLTSELGGFVLQVDPQSRSRAGMKFLGLQIGVFDRSAISSCHWLLFTGPDGSSHYHWIQFIVEGDSPPVKMKRYWKSSSPF